MSGANVPEPTRPLPRCTFVVAAYLPIVNDWARKLQISPSKLFMPLSVAAILGGKITYIGTASNIVVMGLYLAMLFWVNHIGMPVIQAGHDLVFAEQQVIGSRNVRCRAGLDWLFGGLNFQIEHHLAPDCPGPNLRELRAIAHPLCVGAGLPYREEGFRQALLSVTRHVRDIAQRFGR